MEFEILQKMEQPGLINLLSQIFWRSSAMILFPIYSRLPTSKEVTEGD